ncbi:MAG: outer membrane beta-barrel protein [Sphingobium sp.]
MKNILFASAFILTSVSPAMAETFSGPYIGAEIGYDNYEVRGRVAGAELNGLSGNGVVGGVYAGYDLALSDTLFVGAEASLNLSDAKFRLSAGADSFTLRAKETYGFSGRVGAMLNDSTAIYGRLGWANTRFKLSGFKGDGQSAFQYGGGIETRVARNVAVRVEYTALDYGSADLGNGIAVGNNQVRGGIGYRF